MRELLAIISLFVLILGCKEEFVNYNSFVFSVDSIITKNDSISIPFKKMYNGDYTYKVNGNVYKRGSYVNGINVGHWTYNVIAGNSYSFDWRVAPIELSKGKINAPKDWSIFESRDSSNLITFDLQPQLKRKTLTNEYFTILRHENIGSKSLGSYNEYYKRNINKRNVVGENYFIMSIDKRQYLFNRFIISKDKQTLFLYNINGQFDDSIIDVSMVTKNDDTVRNQLIFLEVIRSLKIGNIPFMPRVGVLKMEGDSQSLD